MGMMEKSCMDYELSKVEHPDYYQGDKECIDLMIPLFGIHDVIGFCRCNSFKYRFRAGNKPGVSAAEDLAKAHWYENKLIELTKGKGAWEI